MADPVFFAPLRVPLVDSRTNQMSREWYLFFQALWERSGGAQGPDLDSLMQAPENAGGGPELFAVFAAAVAGIDQFPTIVAELRERVTALENELQAIKQGPIL